MNKRLPEAFEPRLGLTGVFATEEGDGTRLPEDSRLQPIDAAVEAQLRAILQAETFDALILDAVRPQAFDPAVLAPSRFHLLREEITDRLVELRQVARTGERRAEFEAAILLLRARSREHELGETLRYALLKG